MKKDKHNSYDFWVQLNKCIVANKKYHLELMNDYDYSIHTYSEKEIISCIIKDIYDRNIYQFSWTKAGMIGLEKMLFNIKMQTWPKYEHFFSDLIGFEKLWNEAILILNDLDQNTNLNWIETQMVTYLNRKQNRFQDDVDIIYEILNSNLNPVLKQTYLRNCLLENLEKFANCYKLWLQSHPDWKAGLHFNRH